MHHVSRSMSANTGVAPRYTMGAALATHVASGTMTSSPGPMPSASIARCNADVPVRHRRRVLHFEYSANSVSNRPTDCPAEPYQSLAAASATYWTSRSVTHGPATGIRSLAVELPLTVVAVVGTHRRATCRSSRSRSPRSMSCLTVRRRK